MPYPKDEAKLKAWEDDRSNAIASDAAPWDAYDTQIQLVTTVYNEHLKDVAGYTPLNWQIVKAITWVETGALAKEWKTAPMQIGNPGDPGLRDLLATPQGKLILPQEYAQVLTLSNAASTGNLNIEAGVGYLLKILAIFGMVPDAVPAVPASAASAPAAASGPQGSHHASRAAHHHASKPKHPPKHLAITGWRPVTLEYIAKHYNSGDGNYSDKLQFALDLIQGKIKPQLAQKHTPTRSPAKKKKQPMRIPLHPLR